MRTHLILAGLGLVVLPATLGAQQANARAEASVRAEARSQQSTQASEGEQQAESRQQGSAEAALQATVEAGLPEEPVRRVIAEGRAKGASSSAVAEAAFETHARLFASREALEGGREEQPAEQTPRRSGTERREKPAEPSAEGADESAGKAENTRRASETEIVAGAEALAAGAAKVDLVKLRESAPADRSLVASLNALAELSARGFDSSAAATSIAARLAAGANDQAITGFSSSVTSAAQLNGSLNGVGGGLNAGVGAGVNGALGTAGGAVGAGASAVGKVGGGIRF